MAMEFDIAVIGGGIAGLTAVQHALLGGRSVAHVMGMEPMGGLVCNVGELHGYPAGEEAVSGIGLASGLFIANTELGAEAHMVDATALARDGNGFRIDMDGDAIRAGQVIVATGARLRMLDVPGAADMVGRGLSQCAWCDGALYKGQDVVVVGGGDAALEEALHLAEFAGKVTLVTRGDGFRARRAYVAKLADCGNAEVRRMSDVVEVVGGDGVDAVRIHDRQTGQTDELPCRGLFVFIGLEPNAALFGNLTETDEDGRIATDEAMRTATPGLYAVGAVRAGYRGRLVHAVAEAATAAMVAVAAGD